MTRLRRLLIAGLALGAAGVLFHTQLATAAITRGDDALRAGDVAGATRFYERALQIDPPSALAADRLAFNLSMRHDRPSATRAVGVATRALDAGAQDPALLADRAFAELQLQAWRRAERDFALAGIRTRDPRYDHFAARMALRSDDREAALRYAKRALAHDATFAPARALVKALQ